MLDVRNLHTSYGGKIRAIQGVSLKVEKGEIVCLIGGNGAGKSTFLQTLSGLLWPDEGEIIFEGKRIDSTPAHSVTAMGIAQVPEGRRIFPRLTIAENLEMGAFSRSDKAEIRIDMDKMMDFFPVLKERRLQAGGTLSGGEQQMLSMARALMSRPKLLMLDEPSMGLAPLMVEKIFSMVKEINLQGMTVLLVEQNAQQALQIANRAYVLETGRVALEGPAAQLLANPDVQKSYLGIL